MNRTKMLHQLDRSLPDQMVRYFMLQHPGPDDSFPQIRDWLDDYRRRVGRKYGNNLVDVRVVMERMNLYPEMKVSVRVIFPEGLS